MKLASYIGSKGSLIDRAIALRHWGKYSHSELVFSDGVAWSSSNRDRGVRFKRIDFEPAKWDMLELRVDAMQENRIRQWCYTQLGRPYDWDGVFTFVNPFARQDRDGWFCSEGCCAALQTERFLTGVDPWKVWPSRLYTLCRAIAIGPRGV